jgi:D-alanine-D-alanine ligase
MANQQSVCSNVAKINMNIQIVRSSQTKLSSMSHVSAAAILDVLQKNYVSASITIVDNLNDLQLLVASKPDLIFLGMQYVFDDNNNKIWISDFLDQLQIPYTGSGQNAHNLELNKHQAKQVMIDAGVQTSPYQVVRRDNQQEPIFDGLVFPMFVKPTSQGGGAGIDGSSVVNNIDELLLKISCLARKNRSDSLVEQYLTGREFSVAIIRGEDSDELTAMPIELVTQPDENGISILSRSVKSGNNESVLEVTDVDVRAKISSLAIDAFRALGARDYGRIDIRMDCDGIPHFLEANLIPSLIENYGSFPKACLLNDDLDYEPMILRIVNLAFARCKTKISA